MDGAVRLEQRGLREQLKEVLVRRILDGAYPAGSRIRETELIKEFGVSQAPVREALRELVGLRFLESEPHRGVRVRSVSRTDLAETYPVRAALEELAARLAATRVTEDVLAELQAEIDAMRGAAIQGDFHAQLRHDVQFHELVAVASGNSVLIGVWKSLHLEMRTLVTFVTLDTELPAIAESHVQVLEALRSGDPNRAGEALRAHIEDIYQSILRHLPED